MDTHGRARTHIAECKGYSALELLIVVGIIGLATTIILPDFVRSRARSELKQTITELQSNLNMARMTAMNRDTTVTVTLALNAGKVQVSFGNAAPPYLMPSTITAFTAPAQIQYNSYGMLIGAANNQQITLTNSSNMTYSLQVTPGGRTKWCPSPTCP